MGLRLETHAKNLLVLLAGGLTYRGFHNLRRLHPPQEERLSVRVRHKKIIDAAVGSVDVVAFLMGAHTIGLRHHS